LELLNRHRSNDPVLWLTSKHGTPLWRYEEGHRKDLAGASWQKRKLPVPLKAFRSISATLIEGHETYARYSGYFLGHSPVSVREKNYAPPSTVVFDKVLDWLREQIVG
jgi:hypothetical protein